MAIKIVVAGAIVGETQDFGVVQFLPDGSLDTAFGTDGVTLTDFGGDYDQPRGAVLQSDGKIVLAGYATVSGVELFGVARYNIDGSIDSSFGTGGLITTSFPSAVASVAQALALQHDGKVVVVGYRFDSSSNGVFALARYNVDGSLDTSFGAGGLVTTGFGADLDLGQGVAVQASDGKIVAAGVTDSTGNQTFALARYNTNGSLDTSFGTGGKVTTSFGAGDHIGYAVIIQTDGKIVVAGSATTGSPSLSFALARYNTDGSLDTSFGTGGKVTTSFGTDADEAYAVALQTDGKIIAAGRTDTNNDSCTDFALVRYNTNGSLDTGFGTGGLAKTDFEDPENPNTDQIQAIVVMDDDKIMAVGSVGGYIGMASYSSNGSPDTAFGTGGKFYSLSLPGLGFGVIPTTFSFTPTPTPTPTPSPTTLSNVWGWGPSTDKPVESWGDRRSKCLSWPRLREILIKVQAQDLNPYKLAHDTLIDYEDNTTHPV